MARHDDLPAGLAHKYRRTAKRWFPLPSAALEHPVQQALWHSTAQFRVVAAGRRSYKTERAKRTLILGDAHHPGALLVPSGRFFFGAPTFQQAKRIAWNDLKEMTRPFWGSRPLESELMIPLRNGAEIWVVGLDRPERVEGSMWHGMVLDEYGSYSERAWPLHIQPLTADAGAWVLMQGVPEGRNHFYDRAQYARTSGDPAWEFFTWKSADVLAPHVIDQARRDLDERSFLQEYEASFELASGMVYYTFDDQSIIDAAFDPHAPSWLAWDFNAGLKPMAVVLVQQLPVGPKGAPRYVVTKEWVYKQTNTETMCDAIIEDLEVLNFDPREFRVVGDHWGTHVQSASSRRDYDIIFYKVRAKGWTSDYPLSRPTRKIKNRTDSLCAMFRTVDNARHLFVARSCRKLIYDLENVQWKENKMQLDDADPDRTHPSDALSYFSYNYFRVKERFGSNSNGAYSLLATAGNG